MIFRLLVFLVSWQLFGTAWATTPSITKDELRELLGNDQVVVLDVRHPRDWQASSQKIPGAIRITDGNFTPLKPSGRDKRFVLYCT